MVELWAASEGTNHGGGADMKHGLQAFKAGRSGAPSVLEIRSPHSSIPYRPRVSVTCSQGRVNFSHAVPSISAAFQEGGGHPTVFLPAKRGLLFFAVRPRPGYQLRSQPR